MRNYEQPTHIPSPVEQVSKSRTRERLRQVARAAIALVERVGPTTAQSTGSHALKPIDIDPERRTPAELGAKVTTFPLQLLRKSRHSPSKQRERIRRDREVELRYERALNDPNYLLTHERAKAEASDSFGVNSFHPINDFDDSSGKQEMLKRRDNKGEPRAQQ